MMPPGRMRFRRLGHRGGTIDLELDGVAVPAAAAVDKDGGWSWITPDRLTQGGHRMRVTATNQGMHRVTSSLIHFTLDSVAPEPPMLLTPSSYAQLDRKPRFTRPG